MKPVEHQIVNSAREGLKFFGLIRINDELGVGSLPPNFNFTDGEVCALGCVVLLRVLERKMKRRIEEHDAKEKKK
jgi:hypothetical protein